MLATAWPGMFLESGWWFEPKWDGIRGILSWDGAAVTIRTRTGAEVAGRYPELRPAGPGGWVIDGEVVVLHGSGASFERLQQRSGFSVVAMRDHPVSFVAFDLLHDAGGPAIDRPFEDRRAALEGLGLQAPFLVPEVTDDGGALWERVVALDLEGVVAKRNASRYQPGVRSPDWRKIAHLHTVKAIVAGYTPGEGGRSATFGALVLGLWHGDRLRWIGNVGTGFSDRDTVAIRQALGQMHRPDSVLLPDAMLPPFTPVEPVLVAAVEYRNWTTAGRIRHPRFKGFTDDDPATVTWEREGP